MTDTMSHSGNVMLGFVFQVQNPQLQVECFGSPHEVCSYLAERSLQFGEVFDHVGTTVEVQEAVQHQPLLRIHGGPHAEELLRLVEALDTNDATGQKANAGVLRSAGSGVYVPLLGCAARGQRDHVERLLKLGAVPDLAGDLGMSPLHWAAARGHGDVAAVLVAAGASQTARNWFLLTPAELAGVNSHDEVARQLGLVRHPSGDDWLNLALERMRARGEEGAVDQGVAADEGTSPDQVDTSG